MRIEESNLKKGQMEKDSGYRVLLTHCQLLFIFQYFYLFRKAVSVSLSFMLKDLHKNSYFH